MSEAAAKSSPKPGFAATRTSISPIACVREPSAVRCRRIAFARALPAIAIAGDQIGAEASYRPAIEQHAGNGLWRTHEVEMPAQNLIAQSGKRSP